MCGHARERDAGAAGRAGEISAALARVLAAPQFAASAHLRAFLSFVVEAALAGDLKRITAYRIGAEALGRGERFDPGEDPIVRIEATKLRRALERYYLTDGRDDPVRIEVATGGYVPAFHVRAPPAVAPEPPPPRRRRRRRPRGPPAGASAGRLPSSPPSASPPSWSSPPGSGGPWPEPRAGPRSTRPRPVRRSSSCRSRASATRKRRKRSPAA